MNAHKLHGINKLHFRTRKHCIKIYFCYNLKNKDENNIKHTNGA